MSEVILKYSLLSQNSREEVLLLIDKLLEKQKEKPDNALVSYRDKIMSVSVWNEAEIDELLNSHKHFQNWDVPKW